MSQRHRLTPLTVADVGGLEAIENASGLTFWGIESYRRLLEDFPGHFGWKVVIEDEGRERLAGFVLARTLHENLEILKVAVDPEVRRNGIGTRLMEAACREGVQRGCSRCFLEVRTSNQGALQFYLCHQFRVAGLRQNYYTDPVEDAWIMEREI